MDRWQDFRGPLDLGNYQNVERRIGSRVLADGTAVRWVLEGEIDLRDEGFLGRIVEVSVTGGAIEAPSTMPVDAGTKARLAYGDAESSITVRHATPTEIAGITRYGVEWGRLEEPLRSVVYQAVAEARPLGTRR